MLNPVVSHGSDLVWENLKAYIDAGIDMLDLPAPGLYKVPQKNKSHD